MSGFIRHLAELRRQNSHSRISFVSGNFRVIHAGHIRLLRFAREMADMLVVAVLPRSSENASFHEQDRREGVCALSMVDYAEILDGDLRDALRALRPDFVVKGPEHKRQANPEREVLATTGGRLIFAAGATMPSAVDIAGQGASGLGLLYCPNGYLKRRSIALSDLSDLLTSMRGLKVIVAGDVIVDEYIQCDPLGMSQEDPTIVVSPVSHQKYLGGAGIVAAHAAGLGAKVQFLSVCGQDEAANFVRKRLQEDSVTAYIAADESRPTILKQRFRCKGKTLLRVSHLRQHAVDKDISSFLLDSVASVWEKTDLLIFSDFNYGCLPQPFVDELSQCAHDHGVKIVADSQSSSQVGDVSRFHGAALLTPTEREARLAAHDFESGLVVLAETLRRKAHACNVIVTLGESGMLIHQHPENTDQLPALNPVAIDVAGAGDSLLVCASLALAVGGNIWQAACLGALSAAIQIGREGNIPLTTEDIALQLKTWF